MKIAIISDTHDNTPAIQWIIEHLNKEKIEVALHAGDIINPGILFRFGDHYRGHLHFIFGNNDGEQRLLTDRAAAYENITCHGPQMELEIEGKSIFMHHYSVVSVRVAGSGEFDICIGGHDHQYRTKDYAKGENKTLFINPGNTVTKDDWLPQEADRESGFVLLDLEKMETERVVVPH